MLKRKRVKQFLALSDRLYLFSAELKAKAAAHRPGPERDALLKRARVADTAANIDRWASSADLHPPK